MRYTKDRVWQDDAACVAAPEVDKQALTGSYPTREIARDITRRYCRKCPVVRDCLNWAYDDRTFSGIAGGKAFSEDKTAYGRRRVININWEQ